MCGIYKMYNNETLFYIGKSSDFYRRFKQHVKAKVWIEEITHIETATCKDEIEMDAYEKYYINKLEPKYNEVFYCSSQIAEMTELNFTRSTLDDFIRENAPSVSEYLKTLCRKQKRKICTVSVEMDEELFEKFKKALNEEGINRAAWLRSKIREFIEENK